MATRQLKVDCERKMRALIEKHGLPEPDHIEYGCTCIWVIWNEPKLAVRIDIDVDPDYDYDAQEVIPRATARPRGDTAPPRAARTRR